MEEIAKKLNSELQFRALIGLFNKIWKLQNLFCMDVSKRWLLFFENLGSAGIGARIAADSSLNARIGDALGWVCLG